MFVKQNYSKLWSFCPPAWSARGVAYENGLFLSLLFHL